MPHSFFIMKLNVSVLESNAAWKAVTQIFRNPKMNQHIYMNFLIYLLLNNLSGCTIGIRYSRIFHHSETSKEGYWILSFFCFYYYYYLGFFLKQLRENYENTFIKANTTKIT